MLNILKKLFVKNSSLLLDFACFWAIISSLLLVMPAHGQLPDTLEGAGWQTTGQYDAAGNPIYSYPGMSDDGFATVPLQFAFPFYGQTFTHSFMWDNGLVSFYDPLAQIGCNPTTGWCGGNNWNGSDGFTNSGFSYFIAPMWADMKPSPDGETRYLTHGDGSYQSYTWENITEYYSNGSRDSTFGLTIQADGNFASTYSSLNLITSNAISGYKGDASDPDQVNIVQMWNSGETVQLNDWSAFTKFDQCSVDPLYDTSCPGYEEAYYNQQCSSNPLYDTGCPGYAEAYYDQQCSADPLYDPYCPGYEQAYYDQQCQADALYDQGCPGYEQAYYNQQCSADPLYDANCPGYEQAYYNQQCSANPLYDPGCPGYEQAYYDQQCAADPLYDQGCPGYEQAYFEHRCELNPAYDAACPGYNDIEITPNLVDDPDTERTESFAVNIALQQALQHSGAGITIFGIDYGFDYRLGDNSSIDMTSSVGYTSDNPEVPKSEVIGEYSFTDPTNGYESFYNRNLAYTGLSMTFLTQFNMDFSLQGDAGVTNINTQLLFTGDMCTENPLYSTTCTGYEEAYLSQQCTNVGPLYDPQCPGYEQAYYDQQCGIDALYDQGCPGYAEAYYDQQCGIDSLYDSGCPGYAEAYFDQQCGIDSLYDELCPGYAEAYYDQQCGIDALYDSGCPGYEEAYYDQQCGIDALYDTGCPGYAEAYYDQQCSLDPLYDDQCPGYEEAYFAQQCSLDSLYDSGCPGYTDAVAELQFNASCTADPLYDSACPGYDIAKQLADLEEQQAAQAATTATVATEDFSGADTGADMGYTAEPVVETVADTATPMTAQEAENTGAVVTEPEPQQAQASEPDPVVAEAEIVELAVVEESITEEEVAEEAPAPAPEPVAEKKQEVAVVEKKEEAKEEAVAEKSTTTTRKKATVDVMSIVSDVLEAERELVANEVAAAQNNSIAQSTSSSSDSGSNSSGFSDSTASGSTNDSVGSLFDMDITQSDALASTQASTLDQSSAFGDSSSFAGGASNDSAANTASANLGDNLAAGGSISQALSNPGAPPGSNFASAGPSPSQQQSTAKAESLAERMSTEELEAIADRRANSEDEDEYGDQTLDVVIMNSGTDMNAYYNIMELQKQNTQAEWYKSKDIYKNNKPQDNMGLFYSTAGKSEKMIRDMINQQYEEKQ